MTTATVVGPIYGVSQTWDFISMNIIFELSTWDQEEDVALIASGPIIVPVDPNGEFSVDLHVTEYGTRDTHYQCFLQYRRTDGTEWIREPIGIFALGGPGTYRMSDLDITPIEPRIPTTLDVYTRTQGLADYVAETVYGIYSASNQAQIFRDQAENFMHQAEAARDASILSDRVFLSKDYAESTLDLNDQFFTISPNGRELIKWRIVDNGSGNESEELFRLNTSLGNEIQQWNLLVRADGRFTSDYMPKITDDGYSLIEDGDGNVLLEKTPEGLRFIAHPDVAESLVGEIHSEIGLEGYPLIIDGDENVLLSKRASGLDFIPSNELVTKFHERLGYTFAIQKGRDVPDRPNANVVIWYCWDDPTNKMRGVDLWFSIPEPDVPDAPSDTDWNIRQRQSEDTLVTWLRVSPIIIPEIIGIDVRVNGSIYSFPPEFTSNMFIYELPYNTLLTVDIRYESYLGKGVWSNTKTQTLSLLVPE